MNSLEKLKVLYTRNAEKYRMQKIYWQSMV